MESEIIPSDSAMVVLADSVHNGESEKEQVIAMEVWVSCSLVNSPLPELSDLDSPILANGSSMMSDLWISCMLLNLPSPEQN